MTRMKLGLVFVAAIATLMPVATRATQHTTTATPNVDATKFLLAFREGTAEKYIGYRVAGVAPSFRSLQPLNAGAGAKYLALLTVGRVEAGKPVEALRELSAWREADAAGQTLDVAIEVSGLMPQAGAQKFPPNTYTFSGIYEGRVQQVTRASLGAVETPCRHHDPVTRGHGAHAVRTHGATHSGLVPGYEERSFCAPLLTNGELK